jgi:hypothetical protein
LPEKKIENLRPRYKTALQALRLGLEILDNPNNTDRYKIHWARHQIRDAMHILGYTEELVQTYKRETEPQ